MKYIDTRTCNLYSQQRENLQEEDWNPAHGVSEDNEEKSLCDGDLTIKYCLASCLCRLLYGVKHTGIGEYDHNEGQKIQT